MNEDLTQMIGKIMSNPEFGNLVNQLKSSGVMGENPTQPEPSAEDLSKKLPQLMGMLTQSGGQLPKQDSEKITKALGSLQKLDNRNCEKLLCALKPYLRNERGEVIDKALSMLKITDLLGVLQQTHPTEPQ